MSHTEKKHDTAHGVGEMRKTRLLVIVLTTGKGEDVAERRTDQPTVGYALGPIPWGILYSPEVENQSGLFHGIAFKQFHTGFAEIELHGTIALGWLRSGVVKLLEDNTLAVTTGIHCAFSSTSSITTIVILVEIAPITLALLVTRDSHTTLWRIGSINAVIPLHEDDIPVVFTTYAV